MGELSPGRVCIFKHHPPPPTLPTPISKFRHILPITAWPPVGEVQLGAVQQAGQRFKVLLTDSLLSQAEWPEPFMSKAALLPSDVMERSWQAESSQQMQADTPRPRSQRTITNACSCNRKR
ncbi:hypothetical protein NQZ68_000906 [Dissostichus eleginoides]|nr:hypothetical protein NQZ68_000906 [Dissostichus eleginoides]